MSEGRNFDHPGAPQVLIKFRVEIQGVLCWRSLISGITSSVLPFLSSILSLPPSVSSFLIAPSCFYLSVGRSTTGSLISGIEATLCRRARMTRDNGLVKRRVLPFRLLRELIARMVYRIDSNSNWNNRCAAQLSLVVSRKLHFPVPRLMLILLNT